MKEAERYKGFSGTLKAVWLILCAAFFAADTLIPAARAEETMLISSIESQSELDSFWSANAPISLSTDRVTHGTYSLKIDFPQLSTPQFWFQKNFIDVSAYDKIKMDVYLEGTPVVVTARFWHSDWSANYRSWYYLIRPGRQTIEYAIPGLASKIDASRLAYIQFYAESAFTGTNSATLYIDNLRAARGTMDDEWLRNTDTGHPLITVPGNIISNGDFELGLQSWGSWGTWEGGKYFFGTGTGDNAKSGIYSAEITCLTEGRGGINTAVKLEPGTYDLTFWVKGSGPGAEMFYYFSGSIVSAASSCPRTAVGTAWTEKHYTITVAATGEVLFYLFSTGINNVYFDAVSLVRTDYVPSPPPEPVPMTPRIVTLQGRNVLVDGQPFFPIGIYGAKPSQLAGTGFNMVSTDAKATTQEMLDECLTYGMMTWGDLSGVARGHAPTQAPLAAAPMMNHPAILCWYNCDEPDHSQWNVPPPEIRFMTTLLHQADANHPTAEVNMRWTPSNIWQYAHTVDISMIDPYQTDIASIMADIDILRNAVGPSKPIWIVLLSNYDGAGTPVSEYLYVCAYGALTHTANGLFWFSYNPVSYPAAWSILTDITLELKELTPALVASTSVKTVSTSDSDIRTILKEYDGKLCLIAVNLSSSPANAAQLTISGVTAAQARVKFESRNEPITAGNITDDFAPHQRHVYEIGAGMTELANLAAVWLNTGCTETNNWCGQADLDHSTTVNFIDFALLAETWHLY